MKFMKWKTYILTSFVCLLPISLGLVLWNQLPDTMAIHFNFYGEADGWASKTFVVFGLPAMMAVLQFFCCFSSDINTYQKGKSKKFAVVAKWILPVVSIVMHTTTLGYGLGWNLDMRRVAVALVSGMFLVLGNYMPKLDYIKNYKIDTEKARKINRFSGVSMVIAGVAGLVTVFLSTIASVIWLVFLIPYIIISVVYGILVAKR